MAGDFTNKYPFIHSNLPTHCQACGQRLPEAYEEAKVEVIVTGTEILPTYSFKEKDRDEQLDKIIGLLERIRKELEHTRLTLRR